MLWVGCGAMQKDSNLKKKVCQEAAKKTNMFRRRNDEITLLGARTIASGALAGWW